MPSTPYDVKGLLKAAIRDDNPVVFLNHLSLGSQRGEVPDEAYTLLGQSRTQRAAEIPPSSPPGSWSTTPSKTRRTGRKRHRSRSGRPAHLEP
jgi:hypothetical protein